MEPELWPRGRDSTASALVQASRSRGLEGARVVAKVESRHLLRSTGGVVVAAGTLYEQLAQLVPVSFGGGEVAVGDWTEVVKSACGPWISQKCPSDISVSAIEVDDQHEGQRALARVALAVGLISTTCDSAPTSCLQPRSLSSQHDLAEVESKSKKSFNCVLKSSLEKLPVSKLPSKLCSVGCSKKYLMTIQQNISHCPSIDRPSSHPDHLSVH
jgi:hypothetical protein